MRWGLIFAVLALAGCAADSYSDRYAERPPTDIRRLSPIVYADEECPPPQAIAAYCGSMRGRDACLSEPQCAWIGNSCRGIACRIVPQRRRYYYTGY
jgi:hypothetical protein